MDRVHGPRSDEIRESTRVLPLKQLLMSLQVSHESSGWDEPRRCARASDTLSGRPLTSLLEFRNSFNGARFRPRITPVQQLKHVLESFPVDAARSSRVSWDMLHYVESDVYETVARAPWDRKRGRNDCGSVWALP